VTINITSSKIHQTYKVNILYACDGLAEQTNLTDPSNIWANIGDLFIFLEYFCLSNSWHDFHPTLL